MTCAAHLWQRNPIEAGKEGMRTDARNYRCAKGGCGATKRETWNGNGWDIAITLPAKPAAAPVAATAEPPLPKAAPVAPIELASPTELARPEELPARTAEGARVV